jgi:hypothetical protein
MMSSAVSMHIFAPTAGGSQRLITTGLKRRRSQHRVSRRREERRGKNVSPVCLSVCLSTSKEAARRKNSRRDKRKLGEQKDLRLNLNDCRRLSVDGPPMAITRANDMERMCCGPKRLGVVQASLISCRGCYPRLTSPDRTKEANRCWRHLQQCDD